MNIDDLLEDFDGPTIAELTREQQMHDLLTQALRVVANPVAPQVTVQQTTPQPTVEVTVQPPAPEPRRGWTFEFERNGDGTIKRIHATPKE